MPTMPQHLEKTTRTQTKAQLSRYIPNHIKPPRPPSQVPRPTSLKAHEAIQTPNTNLPLSTNPDSRTSADKREKTCIRQQHPHTSNNNKEQNRSSFHSCSAFFFVFSMTSIIAQRVFSITLGSSIYNEPALHTR